LLREAGQKNGHALVRHLQGQIQRPTISRRLVDLSRADNRLTECTIRQDVSDPIGQYGLRLSYHSERRLNLCSSDYAVVARPVNGGDGLGVAIASVAEGEEAWRGTGEACRCRYAACSGGGGGWWSSRAG
jgi:hypothetical protein